MDWLTLARVVARIASVVARVLGDHTDAEDQRRQQEHSK